MPGAQSPSKLNKFKAHHLRAEDEHEGLRITSMMDMMTIILVFLLKTFSTQGDLSATDATLTLPDSDNEHQAGVVDRVAVGEDMIFFRDEPVMSTMDALSSTEMVIRPLQVVMENRVRELEDITRMAGRETADDAMQILILADRTHYYSLVSRVVNTAASSGYLNITLAATQVQPKYQ